MPSSYVTIDNYKGSFESVTDLIKQGYKNIAIVINETEQIQIQERVEGYKGALRKHKIPFNNDFVKRVPFKYADQKIVKEIEVFLKVNTSVDAILFTANNLGINGLESLSNLNIKVAEDIGVICFDDNDLFR